jgi:hypothetical protein
MLDRAARPPPSRAAVRSRRTRARAKAGRAVYAVEAVEHELAEALIRSGRLTEVQVLDRGTVQRELALLIADWAARWLTRHT